GTRCFLSKDTLNPRNEGTEESEQSQSMHFMLLSKPALFCENSGVCDFTTGGGKVLRLLGSGLSNHMEYIGWQLVVRTRSWPSLEAGATLAASPASNPVMRREAQARGC
ncbi:MAG: hypothetical protein QF886_04570, partial [Planctomycetota bacterium]|nr:hypothetical protein [Planctomycetota bacterium]